MTDEDWHLCGEAQHGDKVYIENFVNTSVEVFGKSGTDGGSRLPGADGMVENGLRPTAFVRGVQVGEAVPIILGSGADMSVLPMN